MINVTSPLMPKFDQYVNRLKKIWEKRWMTNNGPMCIDLQTKLEERMQCQVELFVNGHMALDIAIKALNLKGEVITTPYTFASTTHALVMNGCTPVFCDIKPDDYTIDVNLIEGLITDKTCAILPVHVYGCMCDVERIHEIAQKYGLKVIYDAAHAFDVGYKGIPAACFGDVSMFSFHATKVFNTIEGGALAFSPNEDFAHKLQNLRNFGIKNAESVIEVGLNAKMNEFSAAMGLCNLEIVDSAIRRRKEITERYLETVQKIQGIRTMDYEAMMLRGIQYNYAYMPIEIDPLITGYSRDNMADFLAKRGIGARKYFYPLITDFECYRDVFGGVSLPVAERVASRILTLPLAASLTDEEVLLVCSALVDAAQTKCR